MHWYVAILSIDETGVELNIQNNIDMRNTEVEAKLREIGKRYYEKMWDSLITPRKTTQIQIQDQKKQSRENTVVQTLNRPRQIQNKISRCLNFNTEIKGREKNKENEKEVP